ncbi:PREDICTED: SKP1-like protein 11 [Nicotiana attenuata]|uniref:SKP1-like protein n=1 Tax=Nicotiana attenuata TaxID=49451 RepID=A0A1J6JYM6_NICAT|nr:PREDICTED: SKP1-like protein 11 [Nicotiana attenuata]OIT22866.1 skp1-like protein 11 [Nicotiana attenuata]
MASTTEQKKMLILKSSNGDEFEIEESVAVQSITIKNMVEDNYTKIPLPNVDTQTLIKIIEYLMKHAVEKTYTNEEEIENFDKEFVNGKSYRDLFELILAANYLEIKGLLDLLCQSIADRIKNKSANAVRKIFNITPDYSTEEEEEEKVRID